MPAELFPATIVVAIVIFVVKECLEAYRRARANMRKLRAIQALIAAECERNHFAIKRMSEILNKSGEALKGGGDVSLQDPRTGRDRVLIKHVNGTSSMPLPEVSSNFIEKFILDVASLDGELFRRVEICSTSLREFSHVRNSFIQRSQEATIDDAGFLEWGVEELADVLDAVASLYLRCTGKPLKEWRVR